MKSVVKPVLSDILKAVGLQVEKRKTIGSWHQLPSNCRNRFYECILTAAIPSIIAEIKHMSPSHGVFKSTGTTNERIKHYEKMGAKAISYVSESDFFGGSISELELVCATSVLPVLQKDFVLDQFQIEESVANGASAILLIARIVDKEKLSRFVQKAFALGIEPVVEVQSIAELVTVLETDTRVIGVNSRNLDTLEIDRDNALAILSKVPKANKYGQDIISIGFSGVRDKTDIEKYVTAGAKAVLIGSTLMKDRFSNI